MLKGDRFQQFENTLQIVLLFWKVLKCLILLQNLLATWERNGRGGGGRVLSVQYKIRPNYHKLLSLLYQVHKWADCFTNYRNGCTHGYTKYAYKYNGYTKHTYGYTKYTNLYIIIWLYQVRRCVYGYTKYSNRYIYGHTKYADGGMFIPSTEMAISTYIVIEEQCIVKRKEYRQCKRKRYAVLVSFQSIYKTNKVILAMLNDAQRYLAPLYHSS